MRKVTIGFSDLELEDIQAFLERTAPEEAPARRERIADVVEPEMTKAFYLQVADDDLDVTAAPIRRDRRVTSPRDRPRRPSRVAMKGLDRARRAERAAYSERRLVEIQDQVLVDWDAHHAAGFTWVGCAPLMAAGGFVYLQIIGEPGAGGRQGVLPRPLRRCRLGRVARPAAPRRTASRVRFVDRQQTRILRVLLGHRPQRRASRHRDAPLPRTRPRSSSRVTCIVPLVPLGPARRVGGYKRQHHDVELAAPVGGRRVIDAATGKRRRSLAELPFR